MWRLPPSSIWNISRLLMLISMLKMNEAVASSGACAKRGDSVTTATKGLALLDVWAGISSFTDGFMKQAHVPVLEHAWIENAPPAIALLAACYAAAKWCTDFYDYSWYHWKFAHDLIVTGGASCCPFSISGKRLRQLDERSTQGMDTAALAVHLGATSLIIENVIPFLEEDHLHRLVSEMADYLLQHDYVLVATWALSDASLGGCSSRERVFLVWEWVGMASMLPAWPPDPPPVEPSLLMEILEPFNLSKRLQVGGQSELLLDGPYPEVTGQARRAGSLWIRGPAQKWMEGEAVKFEGDHRVWRILRITRSKVKLMFDSRSLPKFQWVLKSDMCFSDRHWVEWPVYSIHGVARAIRHTCFAPGDLYLDDRGQTAVVRPLSNEEKWRVMELPEQKADQLAALGLSSEKGQLAGNSITGRMTLVVAETAAKRLAQHQAMRAACSSNGFMLTQPEFQLRDKRWSATILVVLGLRTQSVVVWGDMMTPCSVGSHSQDAAFRMACEWACQLGYLDASDKCIILERPTGPSVQRAVVYYGMEVAAAEGARLERADCMLDTPLGELAVAALTQVAKMKGETLVNPSSGGSWETGRLSGTAAYHPADQGQPSEVDLGSFERTVKRHNEEANKLELLLSSSNDEKVVEWSQNIVPLETSEVPDALRRPLTSLEWSELELPDPHIPVQTEWQPLPERRSLPTRRAPQGWLSAVRPTYRAEAARRVRAFTKKLTRWMAGRSERPETVVIPGSWLEHWVFEAPHDFQTQPGFAVPVDLSQASASHLNLDFFAQQGQGYPDQELISFLLLGVRYKADLPVQIVLQPHLQSFLPVQEKYLQESDRFIERGWTVCFDSIPLVPYFSAACGSVCRPLEPDRPRCTNDAGAPRREITDDDGVRVVPLNEAIGCSFWPKEVKPSAMDVMITMRILQEAAQALDLTIFCICDDYKSFFNQMRLAPSEYCKTGAAHPPRKGQDSVTFAYDKVLGFGLKMASNIAQRFADFLVQIFRAAIAPVVEAAAAKLSVENKSFRDWWSHRLQLGQSQATLVSILMYCDDPIILCVGNDMTHEALNLWTWMAKEGRTMMAIPEKRSLGLSAKWIGVGFFVSLGLAAATAQKVLRAFGSIDEACSGSLNADQYRSLVGFLEHLRQILFLRGDKMYGLYEPLNWGLQPIEKVKCTPLMELQLQSFKHRLAAQAGSSVQNVQAYLSGQPLPKVQHAVAARRWAIFSDAAKEGTDEPGLGGWICGYVWRVPLTKKDLELHISLLEGVAAVVNVICAHNMLGGTDQLPPDTCIEAHVDAQATTHILIKGRAKSPAMAHLHRLALQIPEFVDMLPFMVVMHVFGLGNIASDAASRGYHNVLKIVASSLGQKLIYLPEPDIARTLLNKCLLWRSKQKHEFCWGDDGTLFGEADHPGPSFNSIKRQPQVTVTNLEQLEGKASAVKAAKTSFNPVHRGVEQKSGVGHDHRPSTSVAAAPPKAACHRPLQNLASVDSLASMLWQDSSPHAICKGNFEQLLSACRLAADTAAEAFSLRTAKQDVGNWTAWTGYCASMNTDPLRPPVDPFTDRVAYLREVILLVNALVYFMKTRRPRSKKDRCIKPQSAMNILLGANRVLKKNFLSFIPLKALKLPLRGLMRDFIQKFGPTSLVPKRRECMTNGMIRTLCDLPAGFGLGPLGSLVNGSLLSKSWRGAVAVASSTGFRKAELFESDEETMYLTWKLVSWIIQGKGVTDPTDTQLQNLTEGDFAVVTPPPSKADQFNTVWGALPVYLPFKKEQRNAAQALQQIALEVGSAFRDSAAKKAVFVKDNKMPLPASSMASALYSAMVVVTGSSETAKLYTWHSFRSYLATALYAANVKPATIQAMLRWQTEESLRAYSRLSRHMAARHLESAANAVVSSVQSTNVPLYEEFELFLEMQKMVDDMNV